MALFDPWKTANRIPIILLLEPLAIAGVSPLLFRELAIFSFLGGVAISGAGVIATLGFFVLITAFPAWMGHVIWKTLRDGSNTVGLNKPTLYLRTSRRTMVATYVGYLIVIVLYAIDLIPSFKSNFNLFAGTLSGFLFTWAYIYPWPLLFEIFPIIVLSVSRYRPPLSMARISILSGLEDEKSPFIDDSIKYVNRILRQWHIRIRDEVKLSTRFFAMPTARRVTLGRLQRATDDENVLDFVGAISSLVQKNPEEVLERTSLVRTLRAYSTEMNLIIVVGLLLLTLISTMTILGVF